MKSSMEKVSALQRRLNIEIPANVVAAAYEKILKDIQKSVAVDGFRRGKVPMNTIRSMYLDRARQDVVQELVQHHYYKALQEHSLSPINYPEFEFDSPDETKEFSFSAFFEVRPEVSLKKYEGLEVEKEALNIGEDRILKVLENIRSARGKLMEVLDRTQAEKGDHVIIDFDGYVDGGPLENGKATEFSLELGGNQFIPGFEEGVIGMKLGEEKTLKLKFPEQYHAADIAGKDVEFKVKLHTIKRKELPTLDDEFVKTLGSTYQSLTELKETIKKDLEQSELKRINADLKDRLLRQLVKLNPVEVPPSLMKEQKQALIEDTQKRMKEQGMSDEEFDDYAKKWDKDFEQTASEMIQSGFLIDTIATNHSLQWNNEDWNRKIEDYAKQTGLEREKVENFYHAPEQNQKLRYMITEEKVISFLLDKAQVKEVDAKKLSDRN